MVNVGTVAKINGEAQQEKENNNLHVDVITDYVQGEVDGHVAEATGDNADDDGGRSSDDDRDRKSKSRGSKSRRVGDKVEAKVQGWTKYYCGEIFRKNSDGTYDVKFEDGERKRGVKDSEIKGGDDDGGQSLDLNIDFDTSTSNEPLLKFGSRMRILFGFMQINAALNLTFDVPWSPYFLGFIDFSRLVNIDFMRIASPFSPCSFNASYLDIFYFHMWILPISLTFTFLAMGVAYFYVYKNDPDKASQKKEKMIDLAIRVINFIVFLLYPGIATRIFRLFKCRRIGELEYLMADYNIVCWKNDHNYAVAVAVLCIFLYVIGIPFISVYILYKRKTKLDDAKTMALFGSLYLAYERKYWYWETVEMLKKMILAGGLVIVAPGSSAQVLIGMLVALSYSLVVTRLEPYDDIVDDYTQVGASIQIVLNLLIGLVLKLDNNTEYNADTLGILLLIMNIAVTLIGFGISLLAFPNVQTCCSKKQKPKKEKKKTEMTFIANPLQRRTSSKGEVVLKFKRKRDD